MSETSHTSSPASSPPPGRVHVATPDQRRTDPLPLLYLLGFLVLGGGLFYLWRNPVAPERVAQDTTRLESLQQQVQELAARVESRPAPQTVVAPLESRVAVLEARPAAQALLAPVEGRLATLEARPVPQLPDFGRLEERLRALEARPVPPAPGTQMSLTDVAGRLDSLSGRLDALTGRLNGDLGALTGRLNGELGALSGRVEELGSDLNGKLAALRSELGERVDGLVTDLNGKLDALRSELSGRVDKLGSELNGKLGQLDPRLSTLEQRTSQASQQVSNIADRAARLARLQAAEAALQTGQKLGEIPGAPPALARFADRAPPTEAALRLSFPAAAEAAHKASQPAVEENQPLLNRTWNRAQQLVTLRQGDRVLVGDPIAGVLARARERLDAGDLDGTLKALDGLAGPAAEAMQPWRAQAQALVDARAALAAQTAAVR